MFLLLACANSNDQLTPAPETGDVALEAPPTAVYEAFEAQMSALGAPGVAVGIWRDGQIVHAFGIGQKGPESTDEVGPDTLFRIGSVTKMMTSAGLLAQVDAGNVELETTLAELVDVETLTPQRYPATTLHHLLSHQGAFFDHTPLEGSSNDERLATYTEGTWARSYSWQMAEAGSFWNYSNPNFALAGLAIERADPDGRTYRQAMREDVFDPLEMDRTLFLGEDVLADGDYATGLAYDWTQGGADWLPAEPDSYDNAWSRPAGFAYSSVSDLLRFQQQLHADERLVTPHVEMEIGAPGLASYGYGVMVLSGFYTSSGFVEEPLWTHGGAIPGFSSEVFVLPDQDFAVAVLSNTDDAYYGDSVAVAIEEMVELPAGGDGPASGVRDDFSRYAGRYNDPWNIGEVLITHSDGTLSIECPTLEAYGYEVDAELEPQGRDVFRMTLNGTGVDIALLEGPDFESQYLVHRAFVGHREDALGTAGAAPTPDLSALLRSPESSLDQLLGLEP